MIKYMSKLALALAIACLASLANGKALSESIAFPHILSQAEPDLTPAPEASESNPEDMEESPDPPPVPFMISDQIIEYFYRNPDGLNICPDIDVVPFRLGSFAYPLGTQGYLVQLLCFQASYQNNYNFFVYRETDEGVKVWPIKLPQFELDANGQAIETDEVTEVVGLLDYEPINGVLTVFTKYRGLGDCGSFAKYQWDQVDFETVEYREKSDCDGNFVEPEDYPQIYP